MTSNKNVFLIDNCVAVVDINDAGSPTAQPPDDLK